jgi:hypothetical protein
LTKDTIASEFLGKKSDFLGKNQIYLRIIGFFPRKLKKIEFRKKKIVAGDNLQLSNFIVFYKKFDIKNYNVRVFGK